MDRRAVKSVVCYLVKIPFVVCNASSGSSECECRTYDHRESDDVLRKIKRVVIIRHDLGRNARLPDFFHGVLEHLPVFGFVYRKRPGTKKLYSVAFKES